MALVIAEVKKTKRRVIVFESEEFPNGVRVHRVYEDGRLVDYKVGQVKIVSIQPVRPE